MKRTTVRVDFVIKGKGFNPSDITNKLGISPSKSWCEGDVSKEANIIKEQSLWLISTGYEQSLDINNQLSKIMNLLQPIRDELNELRVIYNISYVFEVIIEIYRGDVPAIYLESDSIEFANKIKAEFDFDMYVD